MRHVGSGFSRIAAIDGLAGSHDGYAMAVLLVGIAAMGIMLSVAMPVWHQVMQREKEEELIFRGNQYARAVGLFQRKNGNAYPPTIDLLVQQKYLRKKYKDPMVEDGEFQLIPAGAMQAGQVGPTLPAGASRTEQLASQVQGRAGSSVTRVSPSSGIRVVATAIVGVVSKSSDKSIKLYNGRNHYNEWFFVYAGPAGRGGVMGPGGRGGRGPGGVSGPGPGGRGGFGPTGPGQMQPPQFPPTQLPPGGRGRGM